MRLQAAALRFSWSETPTVVTIMMSCKSCQVSGRLHHSTAQNTARDRPYWVHRALLNHWLCPVSCLQASIPVAAVTMLAAPSLLCATDTRPKLPRVVSSIRPES